MPWIGAVIGGIINIGGHLLTSGGPNYPSPPKLYKLPVEKAKKFMENYEQNRMDTSIAEWKKRFPLLYQGGNYEINDLLGNQAGGLSPNIKASIAAAGLNAPSEGDIYRQSVDLGLSPITLSQRTSQAVTRQIASNPEWTNQISGGTLATMMANNYQNDNTFRQFLGANATANYVNSVQRNAGNTGALLAGIGGMAGIGAQIGINRSMSGALNLGNYYAGNQYSRSIPSYYNSGAYSGAAPQVSVGPMEDVTGYYAAPGQPGYSPAGAMDFGQENMFYQDFYGTPYSGSDNTDFMTNPYG